MLAGGTGKGSQLRVRMSTATGGASIEERTGDRDTLMTRLSEYLRWCGEFEFVEDGLQVSQAKWKKYKNPKKRKKYKNTNTTDIFIWSLKTVLILGEHIQEIVQTINLT